MQCVILAAGKGTRMRPLTDTLPKPLVTVCGQTILDHIVLALPAVVTEIILVVGYKSEHIKAHCQEEFHGRKVQYVEQQNFSGGTGDALLCAKPLITGKFLFMYADDIHGAEALTKVVKEDHGMLAVHSDTPERFGVLVKNADGTLQKIIEKPKNPPTNLVNIGGFVAEPSLLTYTAAKSVLGEVYVTDMFSAYAADNPVKIIEQDQWLPIGYPEDVARAEAVLCPKVD